MVFVDDGIWLVNVLCGFLDILGDVLYVLFWLKTSYKDLIR